MLELGHSVVTLVDTVYSEEHSAFLSAEGNIILSAGLQVKTQLWGLKY
jgi:hypothetical protein